VVILGIVAAAWPRGQTDAQSGQGKRGFGPSVVPVATAVVRQGDIKVYKEFLGIVTPVYTVMVKSRVDGQLMSVNYTEGQMVHEGDSLVEIDPRPFQAARDQMEGQLLRDQALLTNANIDLERYTVAFKSNAIPEQLLATQKAVVHQFEGTVKLDQGQLSNAAVQLAYCHITAPISGRVGLRLVDPGNIVHATDTTNLALITQLQPITVIFSPAEDALPEILPEFYQGKKLVVEAYDREFTNKLATGTLLAPDNQIDTGTATLRLKGLFSNEDNSLLVGQFVNVRLLVRTVNRATLVPTSAVQRSPEGTFVYVVQTNQTVAMHPVKQGPTEGDTTAVEGVEPGTVIAADNFNRLLDGIKVTVNKPGEGPGGHPLRASSTNGVKVAAGKPEEEPKQGHGKKRTSAAKDATPQ